MGFDIHKKNNFGVSVHMMLKRNGAICKNCDKIKKGHFEMIEGDKSKMDDFINKVHGYFQNSGHNVKKEQLEQLMEYFN